MLRRRGETAGNLLQGVDIKLSFLDDPDVARFTSSTLAAPDFAALLLRGEVVNSLIELPPVTGKISNDAHHAW